jgi:hypothetical protein
MKPAVALMLAPLKNRQQRGLFSAVRRAGYRIVRFKELPDGHAETNVVEETAPSAASEPRGVGVVQGATRRD